MVEDNKQLASRIDGDLQTAHQEVNLLRQELADTNRRITELTGLTQDPQDGPDSPDAATTPVNGSNDPQAQRALIKETHMLSVTKVCCCSATVMIR
ncbi:Kazrin [Portunus trituberculatus]|uniref:Kazrin n=1 Tax=Portunus trituberculatus TaxID=210409 RepID=A0A5B7DNF6_PORTR|nr:Kazrin [Portunus trituberculatus]